MCLAPSRARQQAAPDYTDSRMPLIADDNRVQLAASRRSWRRPARPFPANPALVLQFMKRRIERSVADLQSLVRHLTQALQNGPAGSGFEIEDLENQQI